jgi:hypothetical protein
MHGQIARWAQDAMNPVSELSELAGRYADGIAAPAEISALEIAIRDDAEFRRWFVRFLHLDAALSGQPGIAAPLLRPGGGTGSGWTSGRPGASTSAWWRGGAAVAAGLFILVGVALPFAGDVDVTGSPAYLVASAQAQWSDPEIELCLRSGDLPHGLLRLESGSAEFCFQNGAGASLLGPATVRFTGPDALLVQDGQVLCRCPTPESRITVTTPTTQVVDLGTEFAVAVAREAGSTRVTVIRGEVRVGTTATAVLHTGQSAEIGLGHMVTLSPLPIDTFSDLLSSTTTPTFPAGPNLLEDASFTGGPPAAWRLSEGHAELDPASGALMIAARGNRFWPGARQTIHRKVAAGQLVSSSVRAFTPASDPLQERQSAILKLVFIDEHGREFAHASRRFLIAGTVSADHPVEAQVATYAPAGTQQVEVQLLLNARGRSSGKVCFIQPILVIAPASPAL